MGNEFAQWEEWSEAKSIDWHLLDWDSHKGVRRLLKDLNSLYVNEPAFHEIDSKWEGFQWIDISDADNSLLSFIRRSKDPEDYMVFILNFTPMYHDVYRFGIPEAREYEVLFNSDAEIYGGSNSGPITIRGMEGSWHNQPCYADVSIPPLAGIILRPKR